MIQEKTGVLLVNTGSPAAPTPQAVGAYLSEFLRDGAVRPLPALPWWLILHACILPRRKKTSAAKYREVWLEKGSPLVVYAQSLSRGVQRMFDDDRAGFPEGCRVVCGMSYGDPSIRDALESLRQEGCQRLAVIPLYPQSAHSTTGSALRKVRSCLKEMGWSPDAREVESYGSYQAYVDAIASSVAAAGFNVAKDRVAFSFHSIPLTDVEAGDVYSSQVESTCEDVARSLGIPRERWSLSYQSPFEDNRTWLGPFTTSRLGALAREARQDGGDVYCICPGFAFDCLETLYDVPHELAPAFLAGLSDAGRADAEPAQSFETRALSPRLVYVPCLNDSHAHARVVHGLVRQALLAG